MEANTNGSSKKSQKILFIIGAVIIVALLVIIVVLSSTSSNQKQAYQATLSSITAIAEQALAEQETQVVAATATPTVTMPAPTDEPTAMPTATSIPTETAAVSATKTGLKILCLSTDYDLPINSSSAFTDATTYVRESTVTEASAEVTIPVRACAVYLTTDHPLDDSAVVALYEAKSPTPWLSKPLQKVDGQDNTYYAILDHQYVIDPPYWGLTYTMKISDANQVYWNGDLVLNRTFNGLCWEGSMPDPVTLQCPFTDVLEREPHPDMPTLVPGGLSK